MSRVAAACSALLLAVTASAQAQDGKGLTKRLTGTATADVAPRSGEIKIDKVGLPPAPDSLFRAAPELGARRPGKAGAAASPQYSWTTAAYPGQHQPPERVGKAFVTVPGRTDNCTAFPAAVLRGRGTTGLKNLTRHIVFTAAGCIWNPDTGQTGALVLAPLYDNGSAPLGYWSATTAYIPRGWRLHGDQAVNYAAVVIERKSGKPVAHAGSGIKISFLDFRSPIPPGSSLEIEGYPSAVSPYNNSPHRNRGSRCYNARYEGVHPDGGPLVGQGCNFVGGGAGGPMYTNFPQHAYALATRLNPAKPNVVYGPLFKAHAAAAFSEAAKLKCMGRPATHFYRQAWRRGAMRRVDKTGTKGGDTYFGENDLGEKFNGKGGRDFACGRGKNDKLIGGPGNDKLNGGKGGDVLKGGPGRDVCIGGPGKDKARGCEVKRSI